MILMKELNITAKKNVQALFKLKNIMQLPRLEKVIISSGAGKIFKNTAEMEKLQKAISLIANQKAVFTKAKKSVANFDVREGMKTGVKVTLRGTKMWEFLDRLKYLSLPRRRDFRGFESKSFNGNTFSFGFNDVALMFFEITELMKIHDFTFGLNITFVFNKDLKDDQFGTIKQKYLEELNFPFKYSIKEKALEEIVSGGK